MRLQVTARLYAGIGLLILCASAKADDNRPFYVDVTELHASTYSVRWRVPPAVAAGNNPQVELPDDCTILSPQETQPTASTGRAIYRCQSSLSGRTIALRFDRDSPSISRLIRYQTLAGEQHSRLLSADQDEWNIPHEETTGQVANEYTLLGIQHILGGTDHLLFIVCLMWIAGTGRRILITITGFTIAHSATLALSALKVVTVPVLPVEASIALSIVILASEVVKGRHGSLTWRYPISVSCVFGLLHGLGFAAALTEIGLPQTELLTGLLFFNIGVEAGQILFAGSVILAVHAVKRALSFWPHRASLVRYSRAVTGYCIGSIASFWVIERCVSFL